MAIPLLEVIDIRGKDVTADALLAQRELADYIVRRGGHYHFTVKGNQAGTLEDLALYFQDRGKRPPDYVEHTPPDHGRIETRQIWTSTELNDYLRFPHVGQAFVVERQRMEKGPARSPRRSPTASPAARRNKPRPSGFSKSTAATG